MDTFASLFTLTKIDSGALEGLSTVAHRFTQPGPHALTILQRDAVVQRVPLRLTIPAAGPRPQPAPRPPGLATPPGRPPPHLEPGPHRIDLSQLSKLGPNPAEQQIEATEEGYVAFHGTPGEPGYAVQIGPASAPTPTATFDSRELGPGDVFATLLLRPGTYRVTNARNGKQGTIVAAYPVATRAPYHPPDPLTVECADAGFTPASISLQPAQGLVFHVNARTRLVIDLVTPDNGPKK